MVHRTLASLTWQRRENLRTEFDQVHAATAPIRQRSTPEALARCAENLAYERYDTSTLYLHLPVPFHIQTLILSHVLKSYYGVVTIIVNSLLVSQKIVCQIEKHLATAFCLFFRRNNHI
jgi:hypothetical protein